MDHDLEFAPACGIKSGPVQFQFNGWPHAADERGEGIRHEIERGRERVVGASLEGEGRNSTGSEKGRQDCLKHQHCAAGGSHGKVVIAGSDRPGVHLQCGGAKGGPGDLSPADRRRRLHGGQVLAQQAGLLPPGADLFEPERLSGLQRKRERCPEDLPPAFPL